MKFPKTLYVVQESDRDGSKWLNANADPSAYAVPGEAVKAAEYKLVREGVVISADVKVS